jgi:hypothetical protein
LVKIAIEVKLSEVNNEPPRKTINKRPTGNTAAPIIKGQPLISILGTSLFKNILSCQPAAKTD